MSYRLAYRYSLNDLSDGDMLDLSMYAEACLDDVTPCVVNIPILSNMLVPKHKKEWDKLFSIKGRIMTLWLSLMQSMKKTYWYWIGFLPFFLLDFSITQWLSEKFVTKGDVLPTHLSDELLESLSVRPYLKFDTVCRDEKALTDESGWNNGNIPRKHILLIVPLRLHRHFFL